MTEHRRERVIVVLLLMQLALTGWLVVRSLGIEAQLSTTRGYLDAIGYELDLGPGYSYPCSAGCSQSIASKISALRTDVAELRDAVARLAP